MSGTKTRHSIYSQVLRYTSLFGGVQGFVMLLSFVRNKFAAVFLGSIGMGLIDVFNRSINLFVAFTSLITPIAVTRNLSVVVETGSREQIEEEVRIIRSWTLLTAIMGLLISLLFSPLTSWATFGNYSHTGSFACIAILIPMSILSGTELSILKATRELSKLAWTSFYGALIFAVVSIPFYIVFGIRGIIPSLLISTFLSLLVQFRYTLPLFRWRSNPFCIAVLRKGKGLIKLSLSYILANVVASGTEFLIRSYMMSEGNMNDVGLYSAGLVITVAASKFLFVAMDADYYPRLSKCCYSPLKMNLTVNRQLEVCVLLIAPFLVASAVFMPVIVRILFSEHFQTVVPMAILATFYMFFKAINTPIAYIPLAKGHGRVFLVMESIYYVVQLVLIVLSFSYGGVVYTGLALSCTNFIECVMLSWWYCRQYHFFFSRNAVSIIGVQGALVLVSVIVSIGMDALARYSAGVLLIACSILYTLYVLSRRSRISL